MTKSDIADGTDLDRIMTRTAEKAVLCAYSDFAGKAWDPPGGYYFDTRLFARVTALGRKSREKFGLIFISDSDPTDVVIAIRGTQTFKEWYNDAWFKKTDFIPYLNRKHFPKKVKVSAGFFSIYSDIDDKSVSSLQSEIFVWLQRYSKARRVLVCGHSLGSALASLCTLDLANYFREYSIQSITFASPRVGGQVWQDTYEKKFDLKSVTKRIVNTYDFVPTVPFKKVMKYHHIGDEFKCEFFVHKEWHSKHYGSYHSMPNYDEVIWKAVANSPQVWTGLADDHAHKGWQIESVEPGSTELPDFESFNIDTDLE